MAKRRITKIAPAPRVKRTLPSKKKKQAKPKPTKLAAPDLKTYFKGKRIAFAGSPTAKVQRFFTSRKATICEEVDEQLDVLFVSGNRMTAMQRKAELLNKKRRINIQITKSLRETMPDLDENLPEYLTDTASLQHLKRLGFALCAEDAVFNKVSIELPRFPSYAEYEVGFADCSFKKSKIKNFRFGARFWELSDNQFEDVSFENVGISSPISCHFDRIRGTNLEIRYAESCVFQNIRIGRLELANCDETEWRKVAIKELTEDKISENRIRNSSFSEFKIEKWKGIKPLLCDSSFNKLQVKSADVKETFIAKDCNFVDCKFENFKVPTAVFENCQFKNCTFASIQSDYFDFRNSKLQHCRFSKHAITNLVLSSKQRKGIKGLPRDFQPASEQFPNMFKLAQLAEEGTLEFSLTGTNARKQTVTLQKTLGYRNQFKVDAKQSDSPTHHEFAALLWLFRKSKIKSIEFSTMKSSLKGVSIPKRELSNLMVAACCEGIGQEPKSAEEIADLDKLSSARKKEIKKAVIHEIMSGDVKSLNKRPRDQVLLASPLRRRDLSGVNLSGANLQEFDFRGCNLTGANLSKADLRKATLDSTNLSEANLSRADFREGSMRNANLTNANCSRAKLSQVDMYNICMERTDLQNADFSREDEHGFNTLLYGIDFSTANLKGTKLDGCTYGAKTIWPEGFSKQHLKRMDWSGIGEPPV